MSETPVQPGDILMRKYRVERQLGAGAMGVVYAAVHVELGHRVAIKWLLPGRSAEVQRQRFLREAQAAVRLKSEHVARVLDVGTMDDGAPYMIMEHLDGRDLAAELQAAGVMAFTQAVGYVLQAAEAVAEAHAAGIVHRDLKPANLFVSKGADGAPCIKVLDFGISKLADDGVAITGAAEALGSPLYMSPEQMRSSRDVDARSDIWALAVTLYELVAGRTPFHGDEIQAVWTRVFLDPPEPLARYRPDVPPGFEAVLRQALEKDRERRYPDLAAFAAALVQYGPPRAALSAERIAGALGASVAPSRPTVELRRESAPVPPAPATTGTGSAVARSTIAPAPPRRGRGLVAGVIAAMVVGGIAAVVVVGGHAGPTAAPAGSGVPALGADAAAVAAAAVALVTPEDAGIEAEAPRAEPAATAVTSVDATAKPAAPIAPKNKQPARPPAQATAQPVAVPPPPVKPTPAKPKPTAYEE